MIQNYDTNFKYTFNLSLIQAEALILLRIINNSKNKSNINLIFVFSKTSI